MIVRELLTRLGFAVNETQLRRYEQGTDNIRRQADAAADSFRNMFAAFLGFGAIKSISNTADQMQSLEARIGMLPQTVTSAGEAFDRIAQKATDARQGIEGYAGFYIKAGNATQDFIKDQEELLKVVDGAAIALAASGSDATRQKEAFFQLGQAIGSPTVQMEEMNTIIDVAPDLFRALGKAIPGANGNLKKFVSTGAVTGEMLAKGLMAILPQFVDQMKAMPMSIGTATVIIGNRWATFINRLNRESSAVTKIANFFLDTFDAIEKGLADMVKFFGGATNTLKFFGIALAAALAPFVFRTAAGAIAFLLSPMGLLLASLLLIGLAIEDFYQWMTGGKSVFQEWFGNFDDAKKKLDEFKFWIDTVKILVVYTVGIMVAQWLYSAAMAAISFAATAAAGTASYALLTAQFLANLAANALWVAGIVANMARVVLVWTLGFAQMLIAALPVILPMLAIIAAITAIVAVIYFLLDNWKNVFDIIAGIAMGNWDRVAKGFYGMVEKLKGYWNSFKSFFGMKVDTTIGAAGGAPVVTPTVAAGAAVAAGGVAGGNSSVVINQTLPPGSPVETAEAARAATQQALDDSAISRISRQMGQVGG